MTIYKPNGVPKKEGGNLPPPEVVHQSRTLLKQEPAVVGRSNPASQPSPLATSLAVYQARRRRRSKVFLLCNLLIALGVIAIGVIGGIVIYRHLSNKEETLKAFCGVRYYEQPKDQKPIARYESKRRNYRGEFEEKVEIDRVNWRYERLEVPAIEECRRAVIVHDFSKNLTAIVDRDHGHCFVMPLNRTVAQPPTDFLDLIEKLQSRYYLPDMEIVREQFRVMIPPINNLLPLGAYISRECHHLSTFWLAKAHMPRTIDKRGADEEFCHGSFTLGGAASPLLEFVELTGCI